MAGDAEQPASIAALSIRPAVPTEHVLTVPTLVAALHVMASNPIPFDHPTGLVTIPRRLWQRLAECHLNSRAKGHLRTWLAHRFPIF
jgi:hypothetical protein